jgi:hypothetical protein
MDQVIVYNIIKHSVLLKFLQVVDLLNLYQQLMQVLDVYDEDYRDC